MVLGEDLDNERRDEEGQVADEHVREGVLRRVKLVLDHVLQHLVLLDVGGHRLLQDVANQSRQLKFVELVAKVMLLLVVRAASFLVMVSDLLYLVVKVDQANIEDDAFHWVARTIFKALLQPFLFLLNYLRNVLVEVPVLEIEVEDLALAV